MHQDHIAAERVSRLLEHRGMLLSYVRKRIASPELAEDLLQDSLLKALRSAPGIRDDEKLLPWFFRVLNNAIIDVYRGKSSAPDRADLDVELLEDPGDGTETGEQALCACFRALLPTLKPEYAEMIERMELGAADPARIAEELGITRNTLKVRRHRARQALRDRLEETCRVCAKHGCLDCSCER